MTTCLMIMNNESVSLAVDSAATFDNMKTSTGFDKLFSLDDKLPIALMIYGSSNFEGILMENLISDFKKETDFTKINTVNKIKKELISFIGKRTPNCDIKKYADEYLNKFQSNVFSLLKNIGVDEFNNNMKHYAALTVPDFIKNSEEYNQYNEFFRDLVSRLGCGDYVALKKFFFYTLLPITGIVIVGFGANENFPSYINLEIIGNNNGKIEMIMEKSKLNYKKNIIIPFAQKNVINSYVNGLNQNLYDLLEEFTPNFLFDFLYAFLKSEDNLKEIEVDDEKIKHEILKQSKIFMESIDNFRELSSIRTSYGLSLLSKESMAEFAEILVKLTGFYYKTSQNLDIVGGDVNVAVLSKIDGFMWIKKHTYYDRNLNISNI